MIKLPTLAPAGHVPPGFQSPSVGAPKTRAAWQRPSRPQATHPAWAAQDQQLYTRLATAIRRICPVYLRHQADDLGQKAALRMIEQAKALPPETRYLRAYLNKVAYCVVVDEIRALRRRCQSRVDPHADAEQQPAGAAPNPEQRALSCEIAEHITDCLEHLSRDRRMAITLSLQGHGVAEAAKLLDWDYKRTENSIGRSRIQLRRCLEAKGCTP